MGGDSISNQRAVSVRAGLLRTVRLVVGAAVIAIGLVPIAQVAAASTPSSMVDLGIPDFGRMVVDQASSHIFVSSPGGNSIVVLNLSGSIVKTITGEAGATSMVVNGSTLYVALPGSGTIDRIDTGTLNETSPLVNGVTNLSDIAFAGGKLWILTESCGVLAAALSSVDPAATTPTVTTYPTSLVKEGCPRFARNHSSSATFLLLYQTNITLGGFETIDVSGSGPTEILDVTDTSIENTIDVVVNQDQTHFTVVGVFVPGGFNEYSISTLQNDGVGFLTGSGANAVDNSSASGGVTLVTGDVFAGYEVAAFAPGDTTVPFATYDLSPSPSVQRDGIALIPGTLTGFAVSGASKGHMWLSVIHLPAPPAPTLPGPPQNVYAIPGESQVWVNWAPPANDGGRTLTSYSITTSPGGSKTTVPANYGGQLDITGLADGTTYTFSIVATNAVGDGPATRSNPVTPGTQQAPYNPSATVGIGSAIVSWTSGPVDSSLPPITSYTVTSSEGAEVTVATLTNRAVIAGLSSAPQTFTVTANNSWGASPQSTSSNAISPLPGGTFNALAPSRILDTRTGNGGFPIRRVTANTGINMTILGAGGVPATGVTAVVLNVTVTDPTGAGFVTAFPTGSLRPKASNLNFVRSQTVPNLVEVAVGVDGKVTLYVGGASANLLADVGGWVGDSTDSYTPFGLFDALVPSRILDTRTGNGAPVAKLGPNQTLTLQVSGRGGVPGSADVSAIVLNVTATSPTQHGYLTVYPAGATLPLASNLNFAAGETVANRVMVALGTGGQITIANGPGSVNILADVNGYFTSATSGIGGAAYVAGVPSRLFDTRACRCRLYAGHVLDLALRPAVTITGLVLNVTATKTNGNGYLTVYPDDGSHGLNRPPNASDLNYSPGDTVPNMTVVQLPNDHAFNIYDGGGSADVVVDLEGYYGQWLTAPPTNVPVFMTSEGSRKSRAPVPGAPSITIQSAA
ncbi:MAG TPA: fibronectin type III domain-containing protein [Candidatus Micrarchaeaceae archaeon]|nr:fibronectin type III domain-containing protein [Candidatus Micrarchaeaceae archaeon]